MNEKFQDFWGFSALLLGNKAERKGKHLQRTSAFSLWTPNPHWWIGQGRKLIRTEKQSVRRKLLKSHRPYGSGTGIKVLWYCEWNTMNTALRNTIRPTAASNEMFASWINPFKTAGGNGTKRPKSVHQNLHSTRTVLGLSSPFMNRRTWGKWSWKADEIAALCSLRQHTVQGIINDHHLSWVREQELKGSGYSKNQCPSHW